MSLVKRFLQSEHLLLYVARTEILHKHTLHEYALTLQPPRQNHHTHSHQSYGEHERIGEAM